VGKAPVLHPADVCFPPRIASENRPLADLLPADEIERSYYEVKDPAFDIIMEGANDRAENTNWSEPPGD
jgi:hypothetical protein